jgi:hypothetical protein
MMNDEATLLEKLRRIEALHAGAATAGERTAAAEAKQRILGRLAQQRQADPPVEYKFSLGNGWSRRLFLALLRRYGLRPYRYPRQRVNTVMVRVPRSFAGTTLWPEFVALDEALREHLDLVAERVISEAIAVDTSEAEEVRGELQAGSPSIIAGAAEQADAADKGR